MILFGGLAKAFGAQGARDLTEISIHAIRETCGVDASNETVDLIFGGTCADGLACASPVVQLDAGNGFLDPGDA